MNPTLITQTIYQIWRRVVSFLGVKNIHLKNLFIQLKLFQTMKKKINFFNKDEVKNMVLNKIEDIDTFIKKLYSTWTNYFEKKKK